MDRKIDARHTTQEVLKIYETFAMLNRLQELIQIEDHLPQPILLQLTDSENQMTSEILFVPPIETELLMALIYAIKNQVQMVIMICHLFIFMASIFRLDLEDILAAQEDPMTDIHSSH